MLGFTWQISKNQNIWSILPQGCGAMGTLTHGKLAQLFWRAIEKYPKLQMYVLLTQSFICENWSYGLHKSRITFVQSNSFNESTQSSISERLFK